MHHPYHIHGAGRFVVLARDDVPEDNLVWIDTALCTNRRDRGRPAQRDEPGVWMAHCDIAKHHESGMNFSFNVAPAGGD